MCISIAQARSRAKCKPLGRGIFPLIVAENCSWEMSMCISIVQARASVRRRVVPVLVCCIFNRNSCEKSHFEGRKYGHHAAFPITVVRGFCMILCRSL